MQDLRLAVRALCSTPIVTFVAVLSLALGIGANTAIFSLVNSLVLKSLPVRSPQYLYLLSAQSAGQLRLPQFSYATFKLLRQVGPFEGVSGSTNCCGKSIVSIGAGHEMANRVFVTGDYFSTLGVNAARGRLFTITDDEPGAPDGPVVVIGHRLWRDGLGGREDVVGLRMTVDAVPVTVVGVAPPDFRGVEVGRDVDLFAPQHLAPQMTSTPFDDDNAWLNVFVRLNAGMTVADATAGLRAAQPQIREASMPKPPSPTFLLEPLTLIPAERGTSSLRQRFEQPLFVLFVVVACVLIIACANIGNLLLARAIARRHELSVRVALGASRLRLARQFFVESAVLALLGAAAGLLVASWATHALLATVSNVREPILLNTPLDWHVVAFTTAAAVATALLFGTVPAVRATAVAPIEALKAHGRSSVEHTPLANGLLVAQITLSLLLVIAAGLFVQTFKRLAHVALGFDTAHTVVVSVTAPTIPAADRPSFFDRLTQGVGRLSSVAASGGALNPPIVGSLIGGLVVTPPGVKPPPDAELIPDFDSITSHWFAAYGIPLLRGRDFDERDTTTAPAAMIVTEGFARRFFPGLDVIGMPLSLTFRFPLGDVLFGTRTIVGVVGNSLHRSPRDPIQPMIYVPLAQREAIPQKDFYLGVRAVRGSPALLERQIGAAITSFSADVGFSFEPLAQQVDDSLAQERVLATLSTFFGGLALLLASVGLYGVTAYTVAQQRTEIGIRLALGAAPTGIVKQVLARVWMRVAAGVLIGAAVSFWASTLLTSLLYGLEPRDPVTMVVAIMVLVVVGTLAGGIPAWRASHIDPAAVLRES